MKNNNSRRVLGIDPGLASTGWGFVDFYNNRYTYIAHGVIKTHVSDERCTRLSFIFSELQNLITLYKPHEAGMETLFFSRNVSSALFVAEAKGAISVCLTQNSVLLREYEPNIIKKAVVGTARADKIQVQNSVKLLLGLSEVPKPDHAADALAVAITHINYCSIVPV